METLKEIFTERMSDYIMIDIIVKIWLAGLIALFVVGWTTLVFELITNPGSYENATFGVFDTLG